MQETFPQDLKAGWYDNAADFGNDSLKCQPLFLLTSNSYLPNLFFVTCWGEKKRRERGEDRAGGKKEKRKKPPHPWANLMLIPRKCKEM